jgi:hypothetical protein
MRNGLERAPVLGYLRNFAAWQPFESEMWRNMPISLA